MWNSASVDLKNFAVKSLNGNKEVDWNKVKNMAEEMWEEASKAQEGNKIE
jgi:hypothetical protein